MTTLRSQMLIAAALTGALACSPASDEKAAAPAPAAPAAVAVRDQVRAAFLDDDPAWLQACWPRYHSVVTAAGERLG